METPGWSTFTALKDTPEMVKQEITQMVSLCTPGPLPLSVSLRPTLSPSGEYMSFLAPDIWRHTLVVFFFVYAVHRQ